MSLREIKAKIGDAVGQELGSELDLAKFSLDVADPTHGDYATNAAMVYARDLKASPQELAKRLVPALEGLEVVESAAIAGPGFINITLTDRAIAELAMVAATTKPTDFSGQVVVTEYSDPNPFKVLHVGHLYTSVVGDAISNLLRAAGAEVHAVNFGGDVGLHVAKTMWAILRELGGEHPEKLDLIDTKEHSEWMARCYVEGTGAYDDDTEAHDAIIELNQRIYQLHSDNDHESPLAKVYWTCRQWSYDYFDAFYARIGSKFEKYYPESENAPLGLSTVREQSKKGVYEESDGALVFKGEPYGLHTRVFVTSKGLPSYEAKDIGLVMAKWRDYHFDLSVVITGNDITEYMKVVLKSLEQFEPELAARTRHITHGNVKLAGGVKMASRKGNFLRAVDVLDISAVASRAAGNSADDTVVIGAVKYAFLKARIGPDLVFVPEESVSLEGNSGPYLHYAHARARSIMAKSEVAAASKLEELDVAERVLARALAEYPDVIQHAVNELLPHYIATYLYELAQVFNRFYEGNRVIGDPRSAMRLRLVEVYADVLRDGLTLLGIASPDRL